MADTDDAGAIGGAPSAAHLAARRWAELAAMFVAGPVAYAALDPGPGWLFPALWAWAGACLWLLLRDPTFDRRQLWNARAALGAGGRMFASFIPLGVGIGLAVAVFDAESLFSLPRRRPELWATIMVLYPLVSVYPQEVIFRVFFFHRYGTLFARPGVMVMASAAAFGLVHVVFHNWIAVAMTLVGGALFAATYARTRSAFAASFEHALYGCLVFTIGLGSYFYSGRSG
ncbi:MAG: CPBP family intramembrane metalloprotease [Phycisphaeraceae bacterium]|nr:CPBP family intramembrane metalloprotease [Phycisphaeraceae bacterium]